LEKRAIVIGATSLFGCALGDKLAEAEYIAEVISLTRLPAGRSSAKVKNQVVDFDHLDNWAELFCADYLFSCLGTTRKQAGSLSPTASFPAYYWSTSG
jgi:nucleoside-diphosphate-sugar epimerase